MKQKISISWKILLLMIGLLLPLNLIGLFFGRYLLVNMEEKIIEDRHTMVATYGRQIEDRLNSMKMYMEETISDDYWNGLGDQPETSNYGLAKIRLYNELDRLRNILFSDTLFVQIHNSGEQMKVRSMERLTYEDSYAIDTWLSQKEEFFGWNILSIGDKDYLGIMLTNVNFNLGSFIGIETLIKDWEEAKGELAILSSDAVTERDGYYMVSEPFLKDEIVLVNYFPNNELRNGMPVWAYSTLVLSSLGCLSLFIILYALRKILLNPLNKIENSILQVDNGDIDYRISQFSKTKEFYNIEKNFNKMMDQIYELRIEKYDLELEKQKMQLINLQQQINPHLLLNSLTTVFSLAQTKKTDKIQVFIMNLVRYLRYSLKNTERFSTVEQETQFINNYIEIQKVRYPNRFWIMYDMDEDVLTEKIPPLIIENFVENSIHHGMVEGKLLEIDIIIKKRENDLIISICDDGAGMEPDILEKLRQEKILSDNVRDHIGVWNCVKRLRLFYGENVEFSIQSLPGEGTQVWMRLPHVEEEEENETFDCGR